MYKVYIKQALQMMSQNRFYTVVYTIGTGLAISMLMILTILYHLHTSNIPPESNRNRMLIADRGKIATKEGKSFANGRLSRQTVKECFYCLQTPECVTAIIPIGEKIEIIQQKGDKKINRSPVMGTDASFWKIFEFAFIAGRPYSEEEFTAGIRKAVICESLSRTLFETSNSVGKTFLLNFEEYSVGGVVKDPPPFITYCYSQIWIPYTTRTTQLKEGNWSEYLLGSMRVVILAKKTQDFKEIRNEVKKLCSQYNSKTTQYDLLLNKQPDTIFEAYLRTDGWNTPNFFLKYLQIGLAVLIILLVPALNLTGMTTSRMKKRLEELGLRKAFGASNKTLFFQILYENMILTLIGGIIGLFVSFGVISLIKEWLMNIYSFDGTNLTEIIYIPIRIFISPVIFGYAFFFCLLLNCISVTLPTWRMLNKPIVNSLNNK